MKIAIVLASTLVAACGASFPVPTQRMADAQSAQRSAKELGAANIPDAQLHMKLADDQIAQATAALKEDENRRADFLLLRDKADAELALALAHEQRSKTASQSATDQSTTQAKTNAATNAASQGTK